MTPEIPPHLRSLTESWDEMNGEGRRQLGRALRRLGLTYGEIRSLVPVPKGTLAGWSRDIELAPDQIEAIKFRTKTQRGVPRDTQRKRRSEVAEIEAGARKDARRLACDPLWIAGTTMYWAEGGKTKRSLSMANTDEHVLRLYVAWVRRYHDPEASFSLMIHLHAGNDEARSREHWVRALELPEATWHKTFIKPPGSGHRKNRLPWGVCRVNVRRSADAFIRTMAWIDVLREQLAQRSGPPGTATIPSGR